MTRFLSLEGENEQLSDRLGKAILEKERNGTKVFKAENDKEYYRQQMDNARTLLFRPLFLLVLFAR